jgi:glycosyltransferase involved in cell wall biosynthesis
MIFKKELRVENIKYFNIFMKKTILLLHARPCYGFAPFVTLVDALGDEYHLKVISFESRNEVSKLKELYKDKDIEFLNNKYLDEDKTLWARANRRIHSLFHYKSELHRESVSLLNSTQYDLLWIIHEQTAYEFKNELKGKKYLLSFYELNDHRRDFLDVIKKVVQNAQEFIVPEYNRACILRVWLGLKQTPTVVPNKPLKHPRERRIPNFYSDSLEGKKIVLYQGFINRSRNLDKVCEAVKDMLGYCIVLMGKGDTSYINELKQKYPQIIHISFIAPPEHLYVTSWAHIAIVKYDFVVLNAIFCAPNKTWEYTGFGIPVLCHDIPGLRYTIGQYKAGVCTDMDNTEAIKAAITEMDSNYEEYSKNAISFYNSCNIKQEILTIVERNI